MTNTPITTVNTVNPANTVSITADGKPIFIVKPFKTLEDVREFAKALYGGMVTAQQVKIAFNLLVPVLPQLQQELEAMTKAQLFENWVSAWRYKNEKKSVCVDAAVRGIVDLFIPPGTSFWMSELSQSDVDRAKSKLDKWTDEIIQEQARKRKKRIESQIKAITEPETLADFDTFILYKGEEALTPEQLAKYDELLAANGREARKSRKARQATVEALVLPEGVELLAPQKTFHTKHHYDLWVVQLSQRVERELYLQLERRAGIHHGSYSGYCRDGAIPGFQFRTPEDAIAFRNLDRIDGEDRVENWEQRRKEKAVNHILEVAQNLHDEASEILATERKDNTVRRARIATSIEADACISIRLVRTMRRIAEAIQNNEVEFIDRLMYRVEFEQLEQMLRVAQYERIRVNKLSWLDEKDKPYSQEDVKYAKFPHVSLHKGWVRDIANCLKDKSGLKLASNRVLKKLAATSHEYSIVFRDSEVEDIRTLADKGARYNAISYDCERVKAALLEYDRLIRLELRNDAEVRSALREYLQYRGHQPQLSPAKLLRRSLTTKVIPGYFPTPEKIVKRMLELADIKPGMDICDPMAGSGHILDQVSQIDDVNCYAIEINSDLCEILKSLNYTVIDHDYFNFKGQSFDRFIANPDFTDGKDAIAVQKMYSELKPGGKIVAVVSESCFFNSKPVYQEFRAWAKAIGIYDEKLPSGSFLGSDVSTGVATRIIVIDKV